MKRAVQSAYRPRVCVCVLSVMCFASAVVFVGVAREKRGRAGLQSTFVLGVCEEGESESEREREREGIWGWRASFASQVLPTQHSMWQGIDRKWEPWLL